MYAARTETYSPTPSFTTPRECVVMRVLLCRPQALCGLAFDTLERPNLVVYSVLLAFQPGYTNTNPITPISYLLFPLYNNNGGPTAVVNSLYVAYNTSPRRLVHNKRYYRHHLTNIHSNIIINPEINYWYRPGHNRSFTPLQRQPFRGAHCQRRERNRCSREARHSYRMLHGKPQSRRRIEPVMFSLRLLDGQGSHCFLLQ